MLKRYPFIHFRKVKADTKLPFKNNSFDYIVYLDVIEHIYDVRFVLKKFSRLLTPNGTLLISTSYHGLLKDIIISLFYFDRVFNPLGLHIRFFIRNNLIDVLLKSGFNIKQVGFCGRFAPLWRCIYVVSNKISN